MSRACHEIHGYPSNNVLNRISVGPRTPSGAAGTPGSQFVPPEMRFRSTAAPRHRPSKSNLQFAVGTDFLLSWGSILRIELAIGIQNINESQTNWGTSVPKIILSSVQVTLRPNHGRRQIAFHAINIILTEQKIYRYNY